MRYNGFRAADVNGDSAPGYSSGSARDAIEEILAETKTQPNSVETNSEHAPEIGLEFHQS